MATLPRTLLRRSLGACTAEGVAAEVVGACLGGAVLTGWALHLGMTVKLIGLIGALPVVAQIFQALGAYLTARFGHRRTAIVAVALSRQAFLPLVLLPALPLGPDGRRVVLLAAAGAHHGLGIVANNAWTVWMGEMVPARLRGRYFGRRTALCTIAGGGCALAAGLALDRGQRAAMAGPVLQALAAAASIAGACSVVLMARQHAAPRREQRTLGTAAMLAPLRDPQAQRLVAYEVAWNAACGLSAPFFGLYLLRDLQTGYALLAAQGAGVAAARFAGASAWGRAVDRVGARRVLVVCTAGLAFAPLAWIASGPGRLWPLAVDAAIGGVLFGGHTVASFAMPLSVAPRRDRSFFLAAIAMAGGVAFAATSAVGCALVDASGPVHAPIRALFAGSAALRVTAVAAAVMLPGREGQLRRLAVPVEQLRVASAYAMARLPPPLRRALPSRLRKVA